MASHPSRLLPARCCLADHHVMTADVVYAPHTTGCLLYSSSSLVISVLTWQWCPMCVVHATGMRMMRMRMMRRGRQHVVRKRGTVSILQSWPEMSNEIRIYKWIMSSSTRLHMGITYTPKPLYIGTD